MNEAMANTIPKVHTECLHFYAKTPPPKASKNFQLNASSDLVYEFSGIKQRGILHVTPVCDLLRTLMVKSPVIISSFTIEKIIIDS